MNKPLLSGVGALLILMGAVWTGQGLGYIKGSFMTGSTTWAVIGPIIALIGIAMVVTGSRRRSS